MTNSFQIRITTPETDCARRRVPNWRVRPSDREPLLCIASATCVNSVPPRIFPAATRPWTRHRPNFLPGDIPLLAARSHLAKNDIPNTPAALAVGFDRWFPNALAWLGD